MNQLNRPLGLFVDDEQTIFVADNWNHRIMEWKSNAQEGKMVTTRNEKESNPLGGPSDVILHERTDSLIICDYVNRKVVRWSHQNATTGTTILSNIHCYGLTMDEVGSLYVVNNEKHSVTRYRRGDYEGTIVAGGNGQGDRLNQLNKPRYVFVDRDHSVYISDNSNHRVMKWLEGAREGIIVAGGQGKGNGLQQLSNPNGIVVDQIGTIYVCDEGNNRIVRWVKGAKEGTTIIGGEQAGLHVPHGLSFDRHGHLYVTEYGNHCVRRFSYIYTPLRGSVIDIPKNAVWEQLGIIVAGGYGIGSATNQFHHPTGLFVDNEQTVYVADTWNGRVMQSKSHANAAKIIAGGNGNGYEANQLHAPSDVIPDTRTHTLIISDFANRRVVRWPLENGTSGDTIISDIACFAFTMDENGLLYAVDSERYAVRRYQRGPPVSTIVAGGNGKGDRLNQLNDPQSVFVDRDHRIYVSDNSNHRVVKWLEGAREGIIVAGGQGKGNGLHQLSNPKGIVVDQIGTVYICDSGNNRVMTWVKGAKEGSIIIGGEEAALDRPVGLSFDHFGNLFVAEYGNHRVQRFDFLWSPPRASAISIPKNAVWKQHGVIVAGGNSLGNAVNQLNRPTGLFVDHKQTVYVADNWNRRVMEWKSNAQEGKIVPAENEKKSNPIASPTDMILHEGTDSLIICDTENRKVVQWALGHETMGRTILSTIACFGLAIDEVGSLYVVDAQWHAVRRYRRGDSIGTIVAGGNGQGDQLNQLSNPRYIFVDRHHTVYVSDNSNHRVMKWLEDTREGIIVAGGQGNGNGLHQLSQPNGIVVDELGSIYVCDTNNNRIMRWLQGAKEGSTIIGGEEAALDLPIGLSFDPFGNLFVAEYGNHRVQRFDFIWRPLRASAIHIPKNAAWKQHGIIVAGGKSIGNTVNQLNQPFGLFVDSEQTVYVADTWNRRIMEWKSNAQEGRIVTAENESESNPLVAATDVILQRGADSLIICDATNRKVVRWPLRQETTGTTILSNIACFGLTMDEVGSLYVVDNGWHAVRKYRRGDSIGTIVAGGNGKGDRLNQLSEPRYIFVDRDNTVYVSDNSNHRVMKWLEGAREGSIAAGGQGKGSDIRQLSNPNGIVVDELGTVYVCDSGNNRIMRWLQGAKEGSIIIGGEEAGLNEPIGLSFDLFGNLFAAETGSNRVQRFNYMWRPLRGSTIAIPDHSLWEPRGIIVAGGNSIGSAKNQLDHPCGLFVDSEKTVYVADQWNRRIMEWKSNAEEGRLVTGENQNESHPLGGPLDVILDEKTDSLIICDSANRKVVRWALGRETMGRTILSTIACFGLAVDEVGSLYVVDVQWHAVRRYKRDNSIGAIVAGGNGQGDRLNQLSDPRYIFVDRDHIVYVSDSSNHRILEWLDGASEGIVVAGGQGKGNGLHQLSEPNGVVVDQFGRVYVCDSGNNRIMSWDKGAKEGSIIIGGNEVRLSIPAGLSFDAFGNLFVAEYGSNRVQRFDFIWRPLRANMIRLPDNGAWEQRGIIVAGGNGLGNAVKQLHGAMGLYVGENKTVFVADNWNNRIMEWRSDAVEGTIVAALIENESNSLGGALDVILDRETDSLIICNIGNGRVIRWPLRHEGAGTVILSRIACFGLTMDEMGSLYVADVWWHAVRRYRRGDSIGTIVAGGNGKGDRLNQLSEPRYIFVDRDHTVYVSDYMNHRVMKWLEGAREGIVVAGGQGKGNGLHQLSEPNGIVVDKKGTVYVCDSENNRVMRWFRGSKEGSVLIGGEEAALNGPVGLSFDPFRNLFVAEYGSNRVQRFDFIWRPLRASGISIGNKAVWEQRGVVVAGGNSIGNGINQLHRPCCLFVDDKQNVYVADHLNSRIMEWKSNTQEGRIVAAENGNKSKTLGSPLDVILDGETDSLIVCDSKNNEVARWPLRHEGVGTVILSEIACFGLTMDEMGSLYVVDIGRHAVRRYRRGDSKGTIVAGGNGKGDRLNQLSDPRYIFVDRDHTVYVSDSSNHRVMKWLEGAREGIVVAGGQGKGNGLHQLSNPSGIVIDELGTVYVCDPDNNRIMRWIKGSKVGIIIIGGEKREINEPLGLSFDRHGNLFVVEWGNHRIERFDLIK